MAEIICYLCRSSAENDVELGNFMHKDGVSVHYYCLLLTSNLIQNGDDDEGISGFLIKDIKAEAKRVLPQKCFYCKKPQANINCCDPKCLRAFHITCGIKNKCLNEFMGTFRSFCDRHHNINDNIKHDNDEICSICYEVMGKYNPVTSLHSICCNNSWFHKLCLSKSAQIAGYFFKCPLCNNENKFRAYAAQRGIFVPDRDAAWELEPNAFSELNEVQNSCVAEKCICPNGPNFKNRFWILDRCYTCGSQSIHRKCSVKRRANNCFVCESCLLFVNDDTIHNISLLDEMNDEEQENADEEIVDIETISEIENNIVFNDVKLFKAEKANEKNGETSSGCSSASNNSADVNRISSNAAIMNGLENIEMNMNVTLNEDSDTSDDLPLINVIKTDDNIKYKRKLRVTNIESETSESSEKENSIKSSIKYNSCKRVLRSHVLHSISDDDDDDTDEQVNYRMTRLRNRVNSNLKKRRKIDEDSDENTKIIKRPRSCYRVVTNLSDQQSDSDSLISNQSKRLLRKNIRNNEYNSRRRNSSYNNYEEQRSPSVTSSYSFSTTSSTPLAVHARHLRRLRASKQSNSVAIQDNDLIVPRKLNKYAIMDSVSDTESEMSLVRQSCGNKDLILTNNRIEFDINQTVSSEESLEDVPLAKLVEKISEEPSLNSISYHNISHNDSVSFSMSSTSLVCSTPTVLRNLNIKTTKNSQNELISYQKNIIESNKRFSIHKALGETPLSSDCISTSSSSPNSKNSESDLDTSTASTNQISNNKNINTNINKINNKHLQLVDKHKKRPGRPPLAINYNNNRRNNTRQCKIQRENRRMSKRTKNDHINYRVDYESESDSVDQPPIILNNLWTKRKRRSRKINTLDSSLDSSSDTMKIDTYFQRRKIVSNSSTSSPSSSSSSASISIDNSSSIEKIVFDEKETEKNEAETSLSTDDCIKINKFVKPGRPKKDSKQQSEQLISEHNSINNNLIKKNISKKKNHSKNLKQTSMLTFYQSS